MFRSIKKNLQTFQSLIKVFPWMPDENQIQVKIPVALDKDLNKLSTPVTLISEILSKFCHWK